MTPEEVRIRVAEIESAKGDDECAHGLEDDLYWDVLDAIASGECADPVGCAREACKTLDIKFQRWMA